MAGPTPKLSRGFDQFHLAVALAVQNFHITFVIPKDEDIPVAKLRLLDRLFKRHWPQSYRVKRTNDVRLGDRHTGGEGMHRDRNGRLRMALAVAGSVAD